MRESVACKWEVCVLGGCREQVKEKVGSYVATRKPLLVFCNYRSQQRLPSRTPLSLTFPFYVSLLSCVTVPLDPGEAGSYLFTVEGQRK